MTPSSSNAEGSTVQVMTLFQEVEHAQAMLDQAYCVILELQEQCGSVDGLHALHAATDQALAEARSLAQLLEMIIAEQQDGSDLGLARQQAHI